MVDSPAFAYVGVGSNIRPEDNVRKALTALAEEADQTPVSGGGFEQCYNA